MCCVILDIGGTFVRVLILFAFASVSVEALTQLKTRWALSDTEGSLLSIAVQLGFATGAVLLALLGVPDAVSPVLLIRIGALGAALATALIVPFDSFAAAAVLRAVTGACLSAVYPPGVKFITTWFMQRR